MYNDYELDEPKAVTIMKIAMECAGYICISIIMFTLVYMTVAACFSDGNAVGYYITNANTDRASIYCVNRDIPYRFDTYIYCNADIDDVLLRTKQLNELLKK